MCVLALLPADFPAAIALVLHIPAESSSLLAQILDRITCLPVRQAEGGELLQAGHVYVAPPGRHRDGIGTASGRHRDGIGTASGRHLVVVENGTLALSDAPKDIYCRPAVNLLFESAASSYRAQVTAVVLTGGNSDGARGVQEVKRQGGTVFAQNEATSRCFTMPQAAIATGCVDAVMLLQDIATSLVLSHGKG